MRNRSFGDFVDKKKRESIRQLRIMKQLLERHGLRVDNYLETEEDHEPYVFCYNPNRDGGFDGIRIYKIGSDLAFRIQKESKTHPYGAAYPLPIESMFSDFLSDDGIDEAKAGKKIIEAVSKEVKKFFERSLEAERDDRQQGIEKDAAGSVLVRTTGTDYSALIYNKG
jgi:hypothetical protein